MCVSPEERPRVNEALNIIAPTMKNMLYKASNGIRKQNQAYTLTTEGWYMVRTKERPK